MLDENDAIIRDFDRQQQGHLFRAIQNGDFDNMQGVSPASEFLTSMLRKDFIYTDSKGRKKDKSDIPQHLQAQWEKDRAKKAENKRARALLRFQAAADPLNIKKGGKKGHKAILAAAKLQSSSSTASNSINMSWVEHHIRRFLAALGKQTMSFPPMDKGMRKMVHEMAHAFNLKSQSNGKGEGNRYTTLIKTTKSGSQVNEAKIAKIVKRGGGASYDRTSDGKKNRWVGLKQKEGEEVGKVCIHVYLPSCCDPGMELIFFAG
jgi:hypothetical protein